MKLWNHRGKKGDGGQCCKEIDRLADFFLQKYSNQIQEGSAVDNAIRLLEQWFTGVIPTKSFQCPKCHYHVEVIADTEQSPEPAKNTGQNPVNAEPGVDELAGFLAELREVVDSSRGVDGWHLNDDIATWDELDITVDRIDQLLTRQKRTVTLCEIHEFCHNLLDEFEIDREDLIEIEAELAQWLKELGIEVVKE